ncbi:MAG: TonB-dependent receptor, partial [Vicinamibacterales bacterium]
AAVASAQPVAGGRIFGTVSDPGGGVLPGVTVEAQSAEMPSPAVGVTSVTGEYSLDLAPGRYQVTFTLVNFASVVRKDIEVGSTPVVLSTVMPLALNAEVTVVAKQTFVNLADVENPAENLVGIAASASQGAITAAQLEVRPLLRPGEVLETVPGLIASSHAGGGKAPQYFLRGFNLDHGTDFAQTIMGMPVNMPTHAHGQGYSDIGFLIPELVSGVQFSKGPYFADQGDFATAGAANTNYVTSLDRPIAHAEGGTLGYGRLVAAASPRWRSGHVLGAFEVEHNDGPFVRRDGYRKLNGILRYSRGDSVNGLALTAMGYHGRWNSTDQVPLRAIASGLIGRFGTLDPSDGGRTYRYSMSADWQRGAGSRMTKVSAYGIGADLDLFSNFTFYLDDPVNGDQFEQADRRFVSGLKVTHKRLGRWLGRSMQNTFGAQLRNDDIANVAVYQTRDRVRLSTRTEASVLSTTGGAYAQNEVTITPWLRTTAGLRGDASRFRVNANDPANSGTSSAGILSPKGAVTLGPWRDTEFYVNAGMGFHSNDARGTTAVRDPSGAPIEKVTPLVRAKGAEVGLRTVAVPRLQSTVTLWMLRLDSELAYSGDTAGSEPSRPSARHGVEFANYYRPRRWLTLDGDISWSHSRYTVDAPEGNFVPEAVGTVIAAGVAVDNYKHVYASLRWRYFGRRTLIEDNSAKSDPTSLFNLEGGYQIARRVRLIGAVYNLFDAAHDDITYFYLSRLPGEAAPVMDYHLHPTIPRAARISLSIGL